MPLRSRSDPGPGSRPPRYPGTFLLAFREAVAALNWQVRRWQGPLVECEDETGRVQMVGLENLFRRARKEDRTQWPALILEFLQTAGAALRENNLPTDLMVVADQLLPRLGQPMEQLSEDACIWSQPIADIGLCVNLVVDYPNRMCYVTEQLIAETGRAAGEWLAQALANLRTRTPADCLQMIDEESGMRVCAVGDAYDSSRALMLDGLLPEPAGDGAFVAVPGRDQLLVLPVTAHGLAFIHLLKVLAEQNYKTTPYPISDEVFWIQNGVWRRFPISIQGQEATLAPPAEFVELLKRLVPEIDDGPSEGENEEGV
jgi:hypothetical protein